jgi:hypothetical protein
MAQKNSPTSKPKQQVPKVTVTRGKAAEAELAAMERAAKRPPAPPRSSSRRA